MLIKKETIAWLNYLAKGKQIPEAKEMQGYIMYLQARVKYLDAENKKLVKG